MSPAEWKPGDPGVLPPAPNQDGGTVLPYEVQQSRKPAPKVIAATTAAAVTVVLVWVAGLLGLDVPPEVASAVTMLIAAGAGYLKRG